MPPRKRLGQLLLELKAVDEHQLQSALGHQKQWGGKLGTILVQKGFIREEEMVRVLSQHVGMPSVKLGDAKVDARAVKMVSKQLAEKLQVFAFDVSGAGRSEIVTVAMSDPTDLAAVDQLAFHTGKRIKAVLSGATEIVAAIHRHYDGRVVTAAPGAAKGPTAAPPTATPSGSQIQPVAPASHGFGRVSPIPPGRGALQTPHTGTTLRDFNPLDAFAPPAQRRPDPPRAPPPTLAPAMSASQPVRPASYVPPPQPLAQQIPRQPVPPPAPLPLQPLEEIDPQPEFRGTDFDAAALAEVAPLPPTDNSGEQIEGLESIASSTIDEGPVYLQAGASGLELDDPTPLPLAEPEPEQTWPPPAAPAVAHAAPWQDEAARPAQPQWQAAPPGPAAAHEEPTDWDNAVTAPRPEAVPANWADEPAEAESQPHEPAPSEWAAAAPAPAAPSPWPAPEEPAAHAAAPAAESWPAAAATEAPLPAAWEEPAAAASAPAAAPARDDAFGEAPADWSASEPAAEEWPKPDHTPGAEAAAAEETWPPPAADASAPAWDGPASAPSGSLPGEWEAQPASPPAWSEPAQNGELPADAIMGEAPIAAAEALPPEMATHESAPLPQPVAEPVQAAAPEAQALAAVPPPPPPEEPEEAVAPLEVAAQHEQEHGEAEAPAAWGAVEDPLGHHVPEVPPPPPEEPAAEMVGPAGWEDMQLGANLAPPDEGSHSPDALAAAEAPAAAEHAPELPPANEHQAPEAPAEDAAAEQAAPADEALEELTFSDDELREPEVAPGAEGSAEPAPNGEAEPLQGWVPPPAEEPASGAGWLGEALAATSPLSAGESGTLAAAGIDPNDGAGALRLLAALLRVLHRRQLIDLDELAAEVRLAQPEAASAQAEPTASAEAAPTHTE